MAFTDVRECIYCQKTSDFYCLACNIFVCFDDVVLSRRTWEYPPCVNRALGHVFVPIIQRGKGYRIMKATTIDQAKKEGKQFATLLGGLFQKQVDIQFEAVSDFAQYFAIDVLGYRDAEIANAWTRGFISAFMKTPTSDELSEQYQNGMISLQQFEQMIRRAIAAPQVDKATE